MDTNSKSGPGIFARVLAALGLTSSERVDAQSDGAPVVRAVPSLPARLRPRGVHWRRRSCAPMPGCDLRPEAFPPLALLSQERAKEHRTRARGAAHEKRQRRARAWAAYFERGAA